MRSQIGQYRILGKIGEGGMGAVFVGEHQMIGRRAAIKVLLPALSAQRDFVDRFFNEARATSAISDPGIVQVFDFGFDEGGAAYIVMELLEGEALDARLRRLGALAPSEALRIARQCAGSLAAAHQRGIVHRDLKPDNLFMVRDPEAMGGERPKILDFGIAKLSGEESGTRTRTGALMGTPVYMSPEQCRGTGNVDHRSDIYALGCVLYHLVAGQPPFNHAGVGDIISAHVRDRPDPPSSFAQLPAGVDEIVMRCLEKAPEARFQSMLELQAACDQLLARISNVAGRQSAILLATPLAPGFRSVAPQLTSVPLANGATAAGTTLPTRPDLPAQATPTAAGQSGAIAEPPRRRSGLWIGLAVGLLVGGGAIAAVVATRGSASKGAVVPAAPAVRDAALPADAPVIANPIDAPLAPPPPPHAPLMPPGIDAPPPPPIDAPPARPHGRPHTPTTNPGDLYDNR